MNKYSRLFLRGCSLLLTGETDNAIQCFVKAYNGYTTDQCMVRLLKDDEDGEGGGGLYWLKLLRLLEQLGSSDGIVQLSLSALKGQSSAVTVSVVQLCVCVLLLYLYRLPCGLMYSSTRYY